MDDMMLNLLNMADEEIEKTKKQNTSKIPDEPESEISEVKSELENDPEPKDVVKEIEHHDDAIFNDDAQADEIVDVKEDIKEDVKTDDSQCKAQENTPKVTFSNPVKTEPKVEVVVKEIEHHDDAKNEKKASEEKLDQKTDENEDKTDKINSSVKMFFIAGCGAFGVAITASVYCVLKIAGVL